MKLTIIGKYGPYPKENGATSGYLIEGKGAKIMLDFGSGVLSRIDGYSAPENLDAIVLSHTHYDHCADLLTLSYRLKEKLPLYMPAHQQNGLASVILSTDAYSTREYDEGDEIRIGALTLTFARMPHPVTSYAIRITDGEKVFVYTGDTTYCDALTDFCRGADVILADAMQKDGFIGPHMTVNQAKTLALECGAQVICTHEPPQNAGDPTKLGLIQAEEGKSYEI
jgi:ribonuclease BN (tRNA processing enzyme)